MSNEKDQLSSSSFLVSVVAPADVFLEMSTVTSGQ